MAMSGNSNPIVLHVGEGEKLGDTTAKAARPELSLLEFELSSGDEIELHLHRRQSDAFYVLDGEVEFTLGRETATLLSGAFALAPPGVVHGMRNSGRLPARLLNIHVPGGFVEYRRELMGLREADIEPDNDFFERHDVFDPD